MASFRWHFCLLLCVDIGDGDDDDDDDDDDGDDNGDEDDESNGRQDQRKHLDGLQHTTLQASINKQRR